MNETVITWNITNWLTVFLMVILGSLVVGAGAAAVTAMRQKVNGND